MWTTRKTRKAMDRMYSQPLSRGALCTLDAKSMYIKKAAQALASEDAAGRAALAD